MNKVILLGNLTRDPELTKTPNDVSVCKFGLAVSRRFQKNEVDFFNIVAWRGTAENCAKYLKKGGKVAIVGSIETRTYEAQDGSKRNAFDIVAEEVQFLSTSGPAETTEMTPVETGEPLPF